MNPYQPETNDGVILSEHKIMPLKIYRRIGIAFFVLALIGGVGWAALYYSLTPALFENQVTRDIENVSLQALANSTQVQFLIVPDATSSAFLNLIDQQSPEVLISDFQTARDNTVLGDDGLPLKTSFTSLFVADTTYENLSDSLPIEAQATLFQMHDELREVARIYREFNRVESLAMRTDREGDLLYPELSVVIPGAEPVMFPSPIALEGYLVTELLARAFPEQALYYRERGEELTMSGVAYGHYSIAEKDVVKAYIDWYVMEAEKNTAFLDLTRAIQASANPQ